MTNMTNMMKMTDALSPNFNDRAGGALPRLLILHYTDTPTARDALDVMLARKVSAHYLVDEDGTVFRVVDEEKRAWHAGKSFWEGEEDVNSISIGIEIQNPGHTRGYRAFPPEQVAAVQRLCAEIVARHGIAPHHVLAHSDIAPARKKDPGELFPWKELAAQGVGIWPAEGRDTGGSESLRELLSFYGYDPRLPEGEVVTAFQRHFQPEVFADPARAGVADAETLVRLRALVRAKAAARS